MSHLMRDIFCEEKIYSLYFLFLFTSNNWSFSYFIIFLIFITVEEVMEEFRHNGRDYEYCPDHEDVTKQSIPRRKKNKKPLPTECVFCRNNGEEEAYYRKHLLKDIDGRVICPVLRYI